MGNRIRFSSVAAIEVEAKAGEVEAKAGERIAFTCGMGMYKGALVVR